MIVTLLTDFGTHDSYVAEMKGVLLARAPRARLVDVSHEVAPGNVRAASYLIGRLWRWFPTGTVHLVVVDPGVGSQRRAIAVAAHEQCFVAPDNGVLTAVLEDSARAVVLPAVRGAAVTFHGRDLFAPAAAQLATGTPLGKLGSALADPLRLPRPEAHRAGAGWVGEVIYIDRFGTLVTNLPAEALEGVAGIALAGRRRAPRGRTFSDVEPGELVAYVGSAGSVEVAVRDGSAAEMTGVAIGAEVRTGS